MTITIEQLENYNIAVEYEDNSTPPSPILLLNNYRVKLVPINSLPIIENFSCLQSLDFGSENVLVIDSGIERQKVEKDLISIKKEIIEENQFEDEPMDFENDKENYNSTGPLETSFLTYDKLRKVHGQNENFEIVGLTIEDKYFDCNPISISEAVLIEKIIRQQRHELFDEELSKLPIWISTFNQKTIPSITWKCFGTTSKNIAYSGITRILGYLNEERSEQDVQILNGAFDGKNCAQINKCRAVFDIIRRVETEQRQFPGEVIVDVRWNATNNVELLSEPICQADCTVKIDVGWRDSRFFTDDVLFNQFFFILDLVDVLTDPEKSVIFKRPSIDFDELTIKMNELIELSSDDDTLRTIGKDSEEITEKVWNILFQCGDIQQVIVLLKSFLQAMSYRKIKSQVHDDNKSHLAQLIRLSKSGDFRMPRLERLNTIEIMMEIGAESLRRKFVSKFTTLSISEEEVEMTLNECEQSLKSNHGAAESRAISLLPIAMTLAAIHQIWGLINERFQTNIPELTRKIMTKFSNNILTQKKNEETGWVFTYDASLAFTILDRQLFSERRARVWTYERTITQGFNVLAKMMTCLQNGINLEHVNDIVNPTRPVKQLEENEKPDANDLKADYTVSHTLIAYYPKLD